MVEENDFPAKLKWADFIRPFFWLAPHNPVVRRASSQLVFSCSGKLSHITTIGPSFSMIAFRISWFADAYMLI